MRHAMLPELSASRVMVVRGAGLRNGEMSVPYRLEMNAGAGWLIDVRCSVRVEPDRESGIEWSPFVGVRIWINEEEDLVGNGASNSFMMMDDLSPYGLGYLSLRRRMNPKDNVFVVFKNFFYDEEDTVVVTPCLVFSFSRDRDHAKVRCGY